MSECEDRVLLTVEDLEALRNEEFAVKAELAALQRRLGEIIRRLNAAEILYDASRIESGVIRE